MPHFPTPPLSPLALAFRQLRAVPPALQEFVTNAAGIIGSREQAVMLAETVTATLSRVPPDTQGQHIDHIITTIRANARLAARIRELAAFLKEPPATHLAAAGALLPPSRHYTQALVNAPHPGHWSPTVIAEAAHDLAGARERLARTIAGAMVQYSIANDPPALLSEAARHLSQRTRGIHHTAHIAQAILHFKARATTPLQVIRIERHAALELAAIIKPDEKPDGPSRGPRPSVNRQARIIVNYTLTSRGQAAIAAPQRRDSTDLAVIGYWQEVKENLPRP